MSTSLTTDSLTSDVRKLEANGSNWPIFCVRFEAAVAAKGKWGHFDGTHTRPTLPPTLPHSLWDQELIDEWDRDKMIARAMLTSKIPDGTLMRVHSLPTVAHRWAAIVSEYANKTIFTQTEMLDSFRQLRCADGNVRDFIKRIRYRREELIGLGVHVDDHTFESTLLLGLLNSYSLMAATITGPIRYTPGGVVNYDMVVHMLCDEYDRRKLAEARRIGNRPQKPNGGDEAMAATTGGSKRKPRGACWNCGSTDHFHDKCPQP